VVIARLSGQLTLAKRLNIWLAWNPDNESATTRESFMEEFKHFTWITFSLTAAGEHLQPI
jgi:hypothetical protein